MCGVSKPWGVWEGGFDERLGGRWRARWNSWVGAGALERDQTVRNNLSEMNDWLNSIALMKATYQKPRPFVTCKIAYLILETPSES